MLHLNLNTVLLKVLRTDMEERFERTALLLGEDAVERLKKAHVCIFGVGGVGGYVLEGLVRCGVGKFTLIDNDTVSASNINRQIIATHSTVGMQKVEAGKARVLDINPQAIVRTWPVFYTPETADQFDFTQYDYIVDAIDLVSCKLDLVETARRLGIPLIMALGTGNKLDASAFQVADISKTTICPLARVMRKELKKRGINHMKVVFTTEEALKPVGAEEEAAAEAAPTEHGRQQEHQNPLAEVAAPAVVIAVPTRNIGEICGALRCQKRHISPPCF